MSNADLDSENTLGKHNKYSWDSIAAINHLLTITDEFKYDELHTKSLGLDEAELDFYYLLETNKKLINTDGPIQNLVDKVVVSVKKTLQLDWIIKEDAKAAMRLVVKGELRGKVAHFELDKILKEVVGQYGNWSMMG